MHLEGASTLKHQALLEGVHFEERKMGQRNSNALAPSFDSDCTCYVAHNMSDLNRSVINIRKAQFSLSTIDSAAAQSYDDAVLS